MDYKELKKKLKTLENMIGAGNIPVTMRQGQGRFVRRSYLEKLANNDNEEVDSKTDSTKLGRDIWLEMRDLLIEIRDLLKEFVEVEREEYKKIE